jgi:hypothetical protein
MEIESKFCSKCGTERQTFELLNSTSSITSIPWPPVESQNSHKKPKDKMVLASIVTVFLIVVLIFGFASRTESPELISSSSESVCENLNSEVYLYFDYLEDWKGDSDESKRELVFISNDVHNRLRSLAATVYDDDIDWDSSNIVSAMINDVASNIRYITSKVVSGDLPPGSYDSYKIAAPNLDISFQSVISSACNQ